MSELDVHERISFYEKLFDAAEQFRREGDPLFLQMLEFYAMLQRFNCAPA